MTDKFFVASYTVQETGKFGQCAQVHTAFEIDDFVNQRPALMPTPAVEFRMMASAEVDITAMADQT